jgi:acyl carrier protein
MRRFADALAPAGFHESAFLPCYGLAEATLMVTGIRTGRPPVVRAVTAEALARNRVEDAADEGGRARHVVGCGSLGDETAIAIVRPDSAARCDGDEVGEIWVQGPGVARGYWNQADETERVFHARIAGEAEGSWLRTGDLGFIAGGELFVTGRIKDLIILHGQNFYPQDVELTVASCDHAIPPGGAAAFAAEVNQQERLVVCAEVDVRRLERGGSAVALDELLGRLRSAVAVEHDLPPGALLLVPVGEIPRTSSGKIQRQACRTRFREGTLRVLATWVSASPASPALGGADPQIRRSVLEAPPVERARLLRDYLSAQFVSAIGFSAIRVDPDRPVAELGLDSLTAFSIKDRIEADLGVTLSPVQFLDGATIARLASDLLERLGSTLSASASRPQQALSDSVDRLSDQEVDSMLTRMLTEEEAG